MSTNSYAGGIWGYVLEPEIVGTALYNRLWAAINDEDGQINDDVYDGDGEEQLAPLRWEIEDWFERLGIIIPERAALTFLDHEAPAYDGMPDQCFILGIGMFEPPWRWPQVDESFKRTAELQIWITYG